MSNEWNSEQDTRFPGEVLDETLDNISQKLPEWLDQLGDDPELANLIGQTLDSVRDLQAKRDVD